MSKNIKIWLIVASCLVLAGSMIFGGVMFRMGWNYTNPSTVRYETNTYEVKKEFHGISLNTDVADITFLRSGDGTVKVECVEEAKAKHTVAVEEDTLVIRVKDEKAWYDHIGINFGSPKITVYLPETVQLEDVDISVSTGRVDYSVPASGGVKIKTSTGRIQVENVSVGSLGLITSTGIVTVSNVTCEGDVTQKVTTGRTVLTNLECKNLTSSGSTGNVTLDRVTVAEKLLVSRTTGDVKLNASDAAEIGISTSTGKVMGSLLTEKVFMAETSTGKIKVPKTISGGRCEINTTTGDIKITIE